MSKRTNTHRGRNVTGIRLASRIAARRKKQRRCTATNRSGERCKTPPVHGTKRCLLHTGDNARVLGARGGRRRAIFNPDGLEPFTSPKSAGDLMALLAQTIVEVRSGKMDPRVANAITYLSTGFLSALETAELSARLERLEARLGTVSRSNVATGLPN